MAPGGLASFLSLQLELGQRGDRRRIQRSPVPHWIEYLFDPANLFHRDGVDKARRRFLRKGERR